MSDSLISPSQEDRTLPAVIYALYLLGFATVVTTLIGLIVAYAQRDQVSPQMRTHLEFQIRTFWMSIGWFLIGGCMIIVGFPFSFILIGIPVFILGWLILACIGVWFAVRCVLGLIHLSRGEAYPRPLTWLI
jgi:uncharacterized membrane protein